MLVWVYVNMKNIIIALTIALSLLGCKQEEKKKKFRKESYAQLNDSLTNKINNAYNLGLLKGFSVAVVNENNILYENGFGYKDIDTTQLYSSSTVQPIASISKTLIGISLIKAVELNLLHLKDPINKYLPFKVINPNHPNNEILIEFNAFQINHVGLATISNILAKKFFIKLLLGLFGMCEQSNFEVIRILIHKLTARGYKKVWQLWF